MEFLLRLSYQRQRKWKVHSIIPVMLDLLNIILWHFRFVVYYYDITALLSTIMTLPLCCLQLWHYCFVVYNYDISALLSTIMTFPLCCLQLCHYRFVVYNYDISALLSTILTLPLCCLQLWHYRFVYNSNTGSDIELCSFQIICISHPSFYVNDCNEFQNMLEIKILIQLFFFTCW